MVFQADNSLFARSNELGEFCIKVAPDSTREIYFIHPEYTTQTITPLSKQVEITLGKKKRNIDQFPDPLHGFGWSVGVAGFKTSFDQYINEIGLENVEILNNTSTQYVFDIHGYMNKFYLSIGGGFIEEEKKLDSIRIRASSGHIGAYFGYNVLNNWITITPTIGLLTYRSRLFNSSATEPEQLDKYIQNKEIDLKMRKYFGSGGIDVNIKLNKNATNIGDYYLLGFRTHYLVGLHNNTILKSRETKLLSNSSIDFGNLHFRVAFQVFM